MDGAQQAATEYIEDAYGKTFVGDTDQVGSASAHTQ